jgi:hypothetical protein
LRAAGETETTQENIQDWLELDEGDPEFQLLTEEETAAVIFFSFIFISTIYIIKISIYLFDLTEICSVVLDLRHGDTCLSPLLHIKQAEVHVLRPRYVSLLHQHHNIRQLKLLNRE